MAWYSEPKGKGKVGQIAFVSMCQKITDSRRFDKFIMYCILANTFILAFSWYMQPEFYTTPIEVFNYLFVLIFTAEAIIKITA